MATQIWTFGRCGLDTISRIEVVDLDEGRDEVTFNGEIVGDTVAKAVTTARQMEGHLELNPDEGRGDTLPVSFVDETSWDGLWRVEDGEVTWDAMSVAGGVIPFSLTLSKVPRGFHHPVMELLTWGATVDNVQGWPVAAGLVAVPAEALAVDLPPLVTDAPVNYLGELSNTWVYQDAEFNGGSTTVRGVLPVRTSYRIKASDYYKSGCKLLDGPVAGPFLIRTGRQVKWDPTRTWVLANEQIQVSVVDDGAGKLRIVVKHWDGTTWDSVNWDVLIDGSAVTSSPMVLAGEVVHNSPERLSVSYRLVGSTNARAAFLTLSIYRGNPVVSCKIKSAFTTDWGIEESGLLDGTLTSGRFEQDAAVNGNKYLVVSPDAITASAANGRVSLTTPANMFRFGIGAIVNSAGSPPLNNTNLRDAYAGVLGKRLYPVGA